MLTLLDSLSLAGDRSKQNDDACGAVHGVAWVLDGATDLHAPSLTGAATDAAWIANFANRSLHATASPGGETHLRSLVRDLSVHAEKAYAHLVGKPPLDHWMLPLASLLLVSEAPCGLIGLDLGDCRLFARDAASARAFTFGSLPESGGSEARVAADSAREAGQTPLLSHAATLVKLRSMRDFQNRPGGSWTFCLLPECAEESRVWRVPLTRPAHILLATDGFGALVDRYTAYDAEGLMRAAIDRGLTELARELRAIETADPAGVRYPRWKKSDDATALLLRLD